MATLEEIRPELDKKLQAGEIDQARYDEAITALQTPKVGTDEFKKSVEDSVAERNAKIKTPTTQQPTEQTKAPISPKTVQEKPKTEEKTTNVVDMNDYQDDSEARLSQISQNLNNLKMTNPEMFANQDIFKKSFKYDERSDTQKSILDNFFVNSQKLKQAQQYSGMNGSDLIDMGLNESELNSIRDVNPTLYEEYVKETQNQSKLDMVNNDTDLMQSQIQNLLLKMDSIGEVPNILEYKKELKDTYKRNELNTDVIDKEDELQRITDLMDGKLEELQKQYPNATEGRIQSMYNKEIRELQQDYKTAYRQYETSFKKLESVSSQINEDIEIKEYQYNLQKEQLNQQMSTLGFAMELMNYETPQQADERAWNNYIKQQDYINGNIYSSDPATKTKAITTAVDSVLAEFEGIPMLRSRDEMVEDISKLIDSGMSLGEAITENIRKPIMGKKEYQLWAKDKFGIDYASTIKIGNNDYVFGEDGQLKQSISIYQGTGMKGLGLKNNNPGNIRDTGFGNIIGTDDKGFAQFNSPEDGFDALVAKIEYNQTNPSSKYYGDTISEYIYKYAPPSENDTEGYIDYVTNSLGISRDTKISDIDSLEMAKTFAKKDSGYNYDTYGQFRGIEGGGVEGGAIENSVIKSGMFDATFETYFEQQKKVASLGTEAERKQIYKDMGIEGYTDFQRLASERKASKPADTKTLQLLEKLDTLENAAKTRGPRALEVLINPDFKADYNFIKSNLSLESLQDAKAKGATFGALSDAEWKILGEAATALSPRLSGDKFQSEIQNIRNQIYSNYPSLNTPATQGTQTQETEDYFKQYQTPVFNTPINTQYQTSMYDENNYL